ncbi:MAG: hypothetical protein C0469_01470 [Cyanobacteria bacterium DS2.3.42]|nr:hypothetical protein [Cyanobacteria bacterium DS2.3.42]
MVGNSQEKFFEEFFFSAENFVVLITFDFFRSVRYFFDCDQFLTLFDPAYLLPASLLGENKIFFCIRSQISCFSFSAFVCCRGRKEAVVVPQKPGGSGKYQTRPFPLVKKTFY